MLVLLLVFFLGHFILTLYPVFNKEKLQLDLLSFLFLLQNIGCHISIKRSQKKLQHFLYMCVCVCEC